MKPVQKVLFPALLAVAAAAALFAFFRTVARKPTATVKEELLAGLEPIGKCLYVYGGGWNEEDTGAGQKTISKGVSPQ